MLMIRWDWITGEISGKVNFRGLSHVIGPIKTGNMITVQQEALQCRSDNVSCLHRPRQRVIS